MKSDQSWERCLPYLIKCDYIVKIEEVLQKGAWEKFVQSHPEHASIELAFRAFLTSVMSNNDDYRKDWIAKLFALLTPLVETINFDVSARQFSEGIIKVLVITKFMNESKFSSKMANTLFTSMRSHCRIKASLVKRDVKKAF